MRKFGKIVLIASGFLMGSSAMAQTYYGREYINGLSSPVAEIPEDKGPILINGGFENGTEGWVFETGVKLNNDNRPSSAATAIHSGAWSARWSLEYKSSITQTIKTVPGATYNISAYVWQFGVYYMKISADDVFVAGKPNYTGNGKWDHINGNFVAKGPTTKISFRRDRDQAIMNLDDITVTRVP